MLILPPTSPSSPRGSAMSENKKQSPATPSPEGEGEGLVDALVGAVMQHAWYALSELFNEEKEAETRAARDAARTALLSRISPSPVNTSGRDPSGPDCRPSDQAPSGLAASGASIPRAEIHSRLVRALLNEHEAGGGSFEDMADAVLRCIADSGVDLVRKSPANSPLLVWSAKTGWSVLNEDGARFVLIPAGRAQEDQ